MLFVAVVRSTVDAEETFRVLMVMTPEADCVIGPPLIRLKELKAAGVTDSLIVIVPADATHL